MVKRQWIISENNDPPLSLQLQKSSINKVKIKLFRISFYKTTLRVHIEFRKKIEELLGPVILNFLNKTSQIKKFCLK